MKTTGNPSLLLLLVAISAIACTASAQRKGPVTTDRSQADADYAVQGEYVGKGVLSDGKEKPFAAQVIAQGEGKFAAVVYEGGLPGAGWKRGNPAFLLEGRREGDVTTLADSNLKGTIAQGALRITGADGNAKIRLGATERQSPALGAKPPAGAIVVFDGSGTDYFTEGQMNDAKLLWAGATIKPLPENYTLHLEFITPYMPHHRGQGRGNSGVYLHDCYELQVLDSFGLEGRDNECGGLYKVKEPDVNMCLPPLVWQTYDIDFTAPKYDANGKKVAGARATIRHNGVMIHDDVELGWTPGRLKEGPGPRGIHLQSHGNKVQYRNIWVVEKK